MNDVVIFHLSKYHRQTNHIKPCASQYFMPIIIFLEIYDTPLTLDKYKIFSAKKESLIFWTETKAREPESWVWY